MKEASVSSFLGLFPTGFARPNRFEVEMQLPRGVGESGTWINENSTIDGIHRSRY